MFQIPSTLENLILNYDDAKKKLTQFGFLVGGNWDFRIGYFDYLLDAKHHSGYLRIPFQVHKGSIEDKNGVIRLGTPIVLANKIQNGMMKRHNDAWEWKRDERLQIANQFVIKGLVLVKQAENLLMESSRQAN